MAYAATIIFFFGKLFHPLPIFDISILLFALFNLYPKPKIKNIYFILFLSFSLITGRFLNLEAFLYFVRLCALLSFFINPPKINKKQSLFFGIILLANLVFGLIQYFFFPDLRPFSTFGWDPHMFRLVSTFFDPTYTGLIYLFLFIWIYCQNPFPKQFRPYLLTLTYIGLALTYSRSSLLSFIIIFFIIAKKQKKWSIFFKSLFLILLTIILLPRLEGEGTKLERTSSIKAKIENYKEGITLFKTSPIIGIGYNNLKITRHTDQKSHAASGFDSSLLTILVTTGITGLILFVFGWKQYYQKSNSLKKYLLLAIIIHSFFSNSWLYPWTLFCLIMIN